RVLGVPRDHVGDVELERRVTALVLADLPPVDPGVRPPVHGPKPQPDAVIGRERGGGPERAGIPAAPRGPFSLMGTREAASPPGTGRRSSGRTPARPASPTRRRGPRSERRTGIPRCR